MTPSGIELATLRLGAQCLNQLRDFVPLKKLYFCQIIHFFFLQIHIRSFNNRCCSIKWAASRSDLMVGASEFSTWFTCSQKELTMVTDNVITFLNCACFGFRISFFRWIIQQDVGWATGELQQQAVLQCIVAEERNWLAIWMFRLADTCFCLVCLGIPGKYIKITKCMVAIASGALPLHPAGFVRYRWW